MENASSIALSRQSAIRRTMNVVANNIANMNTTGFKGEKMMFVEHLVRSKGGIKIGGERMAYVRDIATVRDTTEGPMQATGNPLDLAINGDGFFTVQTPEGPRFTRNGNFQLNEGGQLVTREGHPLLSDGGEPFFFTPEDTSINIARDGTISTENGDLGRIGVVTFANPYDLRMVAGGLMATEQSPTAADKPNIQQGMLEGSNVQPIIEMTRMIEVHRSYESVKNFIDREDERQKRMIQEYAKSA